IDDIQWVGNVEIHVNASDWFRHHHDKDRIYDSVMLHVVAIDDARIVRGDGSEIPQASITFPKEFYNIYSLLSENIKDVRCRLYLSGIDSITAEDWISSLAVERMQQKAGRILEILGQNQGDWGRTCFITFARALGFGLNSEPFELLGRSLSLNYLGRHSDNLFQLEALLFGQAGMLDMSNHIFDEYYQGLCREYYFLARKYSLRPMRGEMWKYSRTRPGNFPHRRIALLAQYLYGGFSLLSDIVEAGGDEERSRELFAMDLDGYWLTHSAFGADSGRAPGRLSESSVDLLLINLVAPLLYAHSASVGDIEKSEEAFSLWTDLPPENNRYIKQWKQWGFRCDDAMHSQGLLQLHRNYCDEGKCLECRFGHSLLRKSVKLKNS
ncbi:MAG: DUF2851 family protein, partial [Muribaculaceae bacterium]|nr:DUF2851 family protein [Muribaculaceae bacterium]